MINKSMKERLLAEFKSIDESLSNEHFLHYHSVIIAHLDKECQGYTERHHILPKSLFPQYRKERWNIVRLPAYDHFLAHYYLFQMLPRTPQMTYALWGMCNQISPNHERLYLQDNKEEIALIYEEVRKVHAARISDAWSAGVYDRTVKKGSESPYYGIPRAPETIDKIREKHWSNWRKPWNHNRANLEAWRVAPRAYDLWLRFDDCGYQRLEKELGLSKQFLKTVHSHFRKGWNPHTDEDFQKWLSLDTNDLP